MDHLIRLNSLGGSSGEQPHEVGDQVLGKEHANRDDDQERPPVPTDRPKKNDPPDYIYNKIYTPQEIGYKGFRSIRKESGACSTFVDQLFPAQECRHQNNGDCISQIRKLIYFEKVTLTHGGEPLTLQLLAVIPLAEPLSSPMPG